MSCVDVMYQPYSPYFPYQRPTVPAASGSAFGATGGPLSSGGPQPMDPKKFSVPKMHEALKHGSSEFPVGRGGPTSVECSTVASHSPGVVHPKDKEKSTVSATTPSAPDAQYLSANCVVFTYYTGDLSTVVDEHFSRALSQPSSYSPEQQGKGPVKDGPPMSQRNFPPSFWNSNYQPTAPSISGLGPMASASHPELSYTTDPYHSGALHASIHQSDPWHYTLSTHAQATNPYTHRPSMHELTYSGMSGVPTSNRFNPQYGSLLLQPSVRSARLTPVAGSCTSLDKSPDTWGTARYHEPLAHNLGHMETNYGAAYSTMGAMTGLEGQVQEASNDLYWF